MESVVTGYFDGNSIVPDLPLDFAVGQKLRVHVEIVETNQSHPLAKIAAMAVDMGVDDLADRHDEYANGLASLESDDD